MSKHKALQCWPPVAIMAMLLLGWVVGPANTAFDRAAAHGVAAVFGPQPRWLLIFTDWFFLGPILLVCVGFALYHRRWRTAGIAAACPFVTSGINAVLKELFGRHKSDYLSYPSGHTTLVVSVMGMLILVAGGALWAVIAGVMVSVLGLVGQVACGYHYATDTIGAVLNTTAWVCVAAMLAGYSASSSAKTSSDKSTLV